MSMKNHTKNELARITSKIQQLKKKYPVSSELYISQEREDNALQEINLYGNNKAHWNQRVLRPKSISQVSKANRNDQSIQTNYNASNSEEPSFKNYENQNSVNMNLNQTTSKIYQSRQSRPQSVSSIESFQINFMKQKPFKQYKEELQNLKKQILSGLDFSNFPLKKLNQTQNPVVVHEQQVIFNKTSKSIQKIDQPKLSQVEEYKHRLLQNRNKKEVKNITSIESSEYGEMKELIKKLSLDIEKQKDSFEERLQKLEFHSNRLTGDNKQIRNQLQIMEESLNEFRQGTKLSQYDLKIVQIQNQSINKLSKDIHKEIQSINIELKDVKQTLFKTIKNDPTIDKKQIEEIVIESLKNRIIEQREVGEQRIKQVQSRFYRQIFDLKNEMELLNQKLKKQDYIERTIKQLIPQSKSKSIDQQIPKIIQKLKSQLSQDKQFLTIISNFINSKLPSSTIFQANIINQMNNKYRTLELFVEQRVSQSYKNVKEQIGGFVENELGYFSTYLKQFQTKMTSYGILIQHLEETMKEFTIETKRQVRIQHNINRNEQHKTVLFDDLIKNSLVFSAMNN